MDSIVKNTVNRYNMLTAGQTVVVGFSGGADSMALLLFLCQNKVFYGIDIIAVHVNHLLRGDEAYRDEEFAKEQCKKLGIELKVFREDIKAIAEKTGEGTEECARRIRYELFDKIAEQYKNSVIATAHNQNDNAETVILNLIRGSGLKGLCGIPPLRDNIIRPLIDCQRDSIEEYVKQNGFSFITDSTNLETIYTRNKIRSLIIPELIKINPSAIGVIGRTTSLLREDEDYLDKEAKRALADVAFDGSSINAAMLRELHDSIKSRVIRKACEQCFDRMPDSYHLAEIIKLANSGTTGQKIQLWNDCFCRISYDRLFFYKEKDQTGIKKRELKIGKNIISEVNGTLNVNLINYSSEIYNLDKKNLIDYDKIKNGIFIRSRSTGDVFTPISRKTKTLKKLFIDEKIESYKRDSIPIVTDGDEVMWVCGFGADSHYAVDNDTKKIINITFERNAE